MIWYVAIGLAVLLALSIPVGAALFLLGFGLDAFFAPLPLIRGLGQMVYSSSDSFLLIAIPLFVLLGEILVRAGIAERTYATLDAWFSWLPGGLVHANIGTATMFSATSGSSVATAATVATVAMPQAKKQGYDQRLFAGAIAAGGALGILLPPSIVMVVYASTVDVSVGRMFLAGVIPGIIAGGMLMVAIYAYARWKKLARGQWAGWREIGRSGADAFWGLMLVVVVLGGIWGGVFTPTEAAAMAAVYAFVVANFIYRDMGPLKAPAAHGKPVMIKERAEEPQALAMSGGAVMLGRAGPGSSAAATSAHDPDRPIPLWRKPQALLTAWVHEDTQEVLYDAGKITITLMFIIANALILKHVLTEEQLPQQITQAMLSWGLGPITFLIVVNLILLIGGQFMEPSGLIVIVAPLVFPIAME
ncbi:MAG: C4-dicarboxylate ABC transporter permease, partial [Pelagibacterium sp.]|nr:C4-dicarboxylate ABC transporter permease [Pelagibacterium sp.]